MLHCFRHKTIIDYNNQQSENWRKQSQDETISYGQGEK